MPNIKHLLLFRDNSGRGWTETHFRFASTGSPPLGVYLTDLVDQVAPRRAALLAQDATLIGQRVSYPTPNGIAFLSKKQFIPGVAEHYGTSDDLCLSVQFVDGANTRAKITHLRGIWDAVEINGEYHPETPAAGDFGQRLEAWKQYLIDKSYGWLTRDSATSSKGVVSAYLADADGFLTFTVAPKQGALPAVGSVIEVGFARLNNGRSPLNRTLRVEVVSATSLRTVSPVAAGPFVGKGTFNYRSTVFVAYNASQNVFLGRRSAGKSYGLPRGRSSARPLF